VKRILLAIVLACPAGIWAQEIKIDVKPGLWENTATTTMSGMQMPPGRAMPQITPEQLAQMPPDARARIESMMKGGAGAPQTTTTKSCITSAQLTRPLIDSSDKSCGYKLTGSSSSTQNIHVECNKGNVKIAGDVVLNRVDSEHMKGDVNMKTTGDSSTAGSMGQNMTLKVSYNAKWLTADCGDVKPASDK
jgi:hypothetical protein